MLDEFYESDPAFFFYESGGFRMISEEIDLIEFPYLLYVFGETGLSKQCRPRSDAAERM